MQVISWPGASESLVDHRRKDLVPLVYLHRIALCPAGSRWRGGSGPISVKASSNS